MWSGISNALSNVIKVLIPIREVKKVHCHFTVIHLTKLVDFKDAGFYHVLACKAFGVNSFHSLKHVHDRKSSGFMFFQLVKCSHAYF